MHSSKSEQRVTTGSRLKMWWLVNIQGYKIYLKRTTPSDGAFGRVVNRHHWSLRKRVEDCENLR